ncbi:peptidylprolyl isomerase [Microlunatus sp. Gsoil 973]|nr:peptidylprolyl isomerase [Microlunatus sp. Gsoil 973]
MLSAANGPKAPAASARPNAPAAPVDCEYTETGTPARPVSPPPSTGVTMTGTATAMITLSAGSIVITLDRTDAPCTVNSFLSLAEQKFYDNTECPRMTVVASLSMLQCGDPTGTQTGGPGYTFPDELSGDETYPAGTVAMANSGPNTNGSQFFLVFADSRLPPDYTVFGHTDRAGIAVLAKIARGGVDNRNGPGDGRPKTAAKIISVTAG